MMRKLVYGVFFCYGIEAYQREIAGGYAYRQG